MASAQVQPAARGVQADHRRLYEQASRLYNRSSEATDSSLLDRALLAARQAWSARPDYIPGLNLLARIEMQRGHYRAAEDWVQQGLALRPESAALLYSAGHIALAQQQLAAAADYFGRSARISRVATRAAVSLAHVKLLQGDYVEAFRHYRELIKTLSDDVQVRSKLFEAASHVVADFYSDELEQDLLRYLDFTGVDHSQLQALTASLLKHKFRLSEAGCPLEIATLASDPLLLKSLQRFYFCDPLIERLLITLRQSLLLSCSRNLAIPADMLPLVKAIAAQCQLNESVWYISDQEAALTDQLAQLTAKMLQLGQTNATDIYPALILVMMYRPLASCDFYTALTESAQQWPASVGDLISAQIEEHEALQQAARQLPSIQGQQDDVSVRVSRQYDENPYPRWQDIGYNQPANYRMSLQQAFPQADLSTLKAPCPAVLVAGCGTGRHAIRLAHYFSPLQITALDISTTALAYASLQAKKFATPAVRFVQGNILNVAALEQQWDIIECSGVLHHMQDPAQGLQQLARQLRPGGVMKVALYSRTARRSISQLRKMMGSAIPRLPADMRLVREALLQKSVEGDWSDIYNSADFYSLSACRDLIFHQQEHTFDIAELPAFAASAGLHWLGMLPPPGSHTLLQSSGRHASDISLEEWQQAEQEKPDLFAGMYQFYLQKPR